MGPTSRYSPRQLPDSIRRRLEFTTALAWESLVETHIEQSSAFVALLAPQLSLEDALVRYFREMDLDDEMIAAIQPRVLVGVERSMDSPRPGDAEAASGSPAVDAQNGDPHGWRRFRPGEVVREMRQRQRRHGQIDRQVRLAIARSEEAVIATHVDNAIAFVALLEPYVPLDRAVAAYLSAGSLNGGRAQTVFQRAMARLADVHLPPVSTRSG